MSNPTLPPGPPYGDGTPYGVGDPFGNAYVVAGAGLGWDSGVVGSPYLMGQWGIGGDAKPIRAKPGRRYLSAVPGMGYQAGTAIAISAEWDEQLGVNGSLLARRMLLDPQVRSSWSYLKYAILGDGPKFTPAVSLAVGVEHTPEEEADAELSEEVTDFCRREHDRAGPVLGRMIDAMIHRSMAAEIVETYCEDGPDAGRTVLTPMEPLPASAWGYWVERSTGRVAAIAGWSDGAPVAIDPDKFFLFSWEPLPGDPRGTSLLTAAYTAWNEKVSLIPERFKHLTLFGSPSVDYEMPPEAQDVYPRGPDGQPDYSAIPWTAADQAMTMLSAFRNGGMLARPSGSKLSITSGADDGGAFTAAKVDCNREIATAILLAPGSTMEAQHDSNANAGTKQDATGILVKHAQSAFGLAYRSVMRRRIAANWGPSVADRLTPTVTFGIEHHDKAGAVATWSQAGWSPDASQFPAIDAEVGLPPRATATPEEAEDAEDIEGTDPDDDTQGKLAVDDPAAFSAGKKKRHRQEGHHESQGRHGYNPNRDDHGRFAPGRGTAERSKQADLTRAARREALGNFPNSPGSRDLVKSLAAHPRSRTGEGRGQFRQQRKDQTALAASKRSNSKAASDAVDVAARAYAVRRATAPGKASPAHLGDREFATRVHAAAVSAPTGSYGGNKVFINHAHDHAVKTDPVLAKMSLPEFKAKLIEGHRAGTLELGRADLIESMHPADVAASATPHGNAVYHFVRTPEGVENPHPYHPDIRPKSPAPVPGHRTGHARFADDHTPLDWSVDDPITDDDIREALDLIAELAADIDLDNLTAEQSRAILHAIADSTAADLHAMAEELRAEITPAEFGVRDAIGGFFKRAAKTLRTAYLASVLAVLGPNGMDADAREAAAVQIARQGAYLKQFEADVRSGDQAPDGTLPARAGMYGDAAWSVGMNTGRDVEQHTEERRILGAADEHCPECPPLAALGWQPAGSLPEIGSTVCRIQCRCHWEYR